MTTNEIISNINSNGGFNNYHRWNQKETAEWVRSNFPCSRYVADRVARLIK